MTLVCCWVISNVQDASCNLCSHHLDINPSNMDGYCGRCDVVITNIMGEYCPRCPTKLYIRSVEFRTPTTTQAPSDATQQDQRAPPPQRQHNTQEIDSRYGVEAPLSYIASHEQLDPRHRNNLTRVPVRATAIANHPPTERINAEHSHAFLVPDTPVLAVDTPMQDSTPVFEHRPFHTYRDARS
jgi:hypothetical protein